MNDMTSRAPASTVTRQAISAAAERIAPHIRRTPVIEIDGRPFGLDGPLALKLELLQHSGSFKARGAFNNLLGAKVPKAGVVAASGGNHGAAVAYAAQRLGVPARIFVPEISAPAKIARIRAYGADIVVGGARYNDALRASEDWIAESGALSVHAYDAVPTLEGQGTVAMEFAEQTPGLDTVLVAVGGGGLIGGMAAWYRREVKLVAVEPETSRALDAALAAGQPVDVDVSGVAADSLGARSVGRLMYPIARDFVERVVLVSDDAIRAAQVWLWDNLRVAAEPGGAAAFGALLSGRYQPAPGERLGILVCGGNLDPASLA
jgi:threonine dehydratase